MRPEGKRLAVFNPNESLRSLSVGDMLRHTLSGEVWMVDSMGWIMMEVAGREYRRPMDPSTTPLA